jgi:kumamolisin
VADQAYVALPESARSAVPGAQMTGAVDPNEVIQVSLYLRPKAAPDVPTGPGRLTTREAFATNFGADPADVAKVTAFAEAHGLRVVQSDLTRRVVVLSGPVSAMTATFQVQLQRYTYQQDQGQTFRGRTGTLQLPQDLAPIIQAVLGLDNRRQALSHMRMIIPPGGATAQPKAPQNGFARFFRRLAGRSAAPQPTAVPAGGFTPVQLATLYHYPTAGNGRGETIGIIELGGGYKTQDLVNYFNGLGITPPSVTSVAVDGGSNAPSGDPNSADGEVVLDIEVAGAVAPGAQIAVYFAPNTDQGFIDAISTAVHDTQHRPSVISISWGGPENSWTTQAAQQMNQICQEAATLGVTICVAAGDSGSDDGVGDGNAHVDFPASSPFVLACGGTRLQAAGTTITSETVWNDGNGNGATGGGVSDLFALPTWQQSAQIPPSVNPGNRVGRGVPDVAGDADPQSGISVLVDGQAALVGGTSAVAPLYAGLVALLNQQLGKPVGLLNPALYQYPTVARDIIGGTNALNGAPGYSAGGGWDACTGLGVVDGTQLLAALQAPIPTTTGA